MEKIELPWGQIISLYCIMGTIVLTLLTVSGYIILRLLEAFGVIQHMETIQTGFKILQRTGNFNLGVFGQGRYPAYFITNRSGKTLHTGQRKHIIEVWNTRYNWSHRRYTQTRMEAFIDSYFIDACHWLANPN